MCMLQLCRQYMNRHKRHIYAKMIKCLQIYQVHVKYNPSAISLTQTSPEAKGDA